MTPRVAQLLDKGGGELRPTHYKGLTYGLNVAALKICFIKGIGLKFLFQKDRTVPTVPKFQ